MTPDGFVRAMVGGRDYGQSQFNRSVDALRSPGSTFKAFVYATAMENGYDASSVMTDRYVQYGGWSPKNYTRSYSGRVTLTTALVKSINTIPVQLNQIIGGSKVVAKTIEMGVTSPLRNNPSLPIGTSEVSVIDMAAGYSVLANGGYKATPQAVLRIYDSRGDLILDNSTKTLSQRVLKPSSVASMNEILSQVPEWGTGRRAKLDDRVTAGKTGTTQAYRDAWFIGYTGNYVGAVWYGNDDYSPTNRLTGGRLPAMTWKEVMTFAHQGVDEKPIPYLNKDGSKEKQIVDVIAENKNETIEPLQETRALSTRSTTVLQGIGKLLEKKAKPLTTAFIPLKAPTGNGLATIAGEF